jgi:hypothetical protein
MAGRPKTRAREQARKEAAQGTEKPTQAVRGECKGGDTPERQKKPVRRSESVVQEMLWRIAGDARSLRDVCQDADMPSYRTAYDWLNADPDLRARYEMARAERGDFHGEQVLEIARQVREGELDPQAGKVAMDGVKWSAGRMAPKAWGDRSQVDMNVRNDSAEDHIAAIQELTARKDCNRKAQRKEPVAAEVWTEDEADHEDVPDDATRH